MENLCENKESKAISFLLTFYLSSILIFSFSKDSLVYSQLAFILTFGSMVLFFVIKKISIRLDIFSILFLLFVLFCYVSSVWAKNPERTIGKVYTLIQLFLMSVILFTYLSYTEGTESFMMCLFISGLISSVYILGYYGIDGYKKLLLEGERVGAEITNVNTIGMNMAYTVVIGFYYGYMKKKKYAYFLIILPVILSLGSGSRKALTLLVAGVALILLMDYRKNVSLSKFLKVFLAGAALVTVVYWLSTLPAFETIFNRFDAMLESGSKQDGSSRIREKMIEAGWEYFKNHPFTGVGINNSNYITYHYVGKNTYLHNNFVELLASIGIFGFLIYYSMYIYVLINLFTLSENSTSALILFVIILMQLILDYGMVSYPEKMTYVYLAAAAAEVNILKKRLREKDEEKINECAL